MSELSDGGNPPGREPNPNNRRKRPNGRKRRTNKETQSDFNNPQLEASSVESVPEEGMEHSGVGPNSKPSHPQGSNGQTGQVEAHKPRRYYAALDLGTNNCRLLVATPQQRGRFRVVDGFSRIVRLGEGLSQTGRLSDLAMDRAIEALKVCAEKLQAKTIAGQRLIATEACRQAENGEEFLHRVKEETGIDLEVISREKEAYLAAEGCGALMDRRSDGAVLFDIGGGSSELILVDRKRGNRRNISEQVASWTSLPMGVVTLAERFGGKHVTHELFAEMVDCVFGYIEKFEGRNALKHIASDGNMHLLGTSGTVTTLAGVHLKLPRYERRRVDGLWLHDREIDGIIHQLIDMPFEDRAANPCIGSERADLVLAGCAILNAIRKAWPTERLRVADRGLREGLLTQMMQNDRAWLPAHKRRWSKKRRNRRGREAAKREA